MDKDRSHFNAARYGNEWRETSLRTRKSTNFKCCLCQKRAVLAHHATYKNKRGRSIRNYEKAGIHVFPLCEDCHKIAHLKKNWVWDEANPVLNNQNSPEFYRKLRNGWKKLRGMAK
jgi:hypothetical protein